MKPFKEKVAALDNQINRLTIEKPFGWQTKCKALQREIQHLIEKGDE
jgi:hypothetical protein